MKRVLLIAGAIVMCASMAFAVVTPGSGGVFVMYSDAAYTNCNLVDAGATLEVVYVRHELIPCATAGEFKIENHGYTGTWLAEDYLGNLALGNSQTGLALAYAGFRTLPWPMVKVTYFGSGTTPPCSFLKVVRDPREPDGIIAAVDCNQHKLAAAGSILTINGGSACPCTLPVQESNWSRIKSLYNK